MHNQNYLNKIILGDSLEILKHFDENSIDLVLTDPPYFLDKMDNNWNYNKVADTRNQQIVKSLPSGMAFNKKLGVEFYEWFNLISAEILRVLKPGAFFFSFSSPRLYHRLVSAIDDAGFEIRDNFIWLYTLNQPKAMSLNHFIDKMAISEGEKNALKDQFKGWKTPQIKSCYEPIVMAQKPVDNTFLKTFIEYGTGLINTEVKVGNNMFPANVLTIDDINPLIDKYFLISKPNKREKGENNHHKTVKPIEICEHIIKLTSFNKDAVVLDPFVGSGTTAVAAKSLGLNYIGIDTNPEYIQIADERLSQISKSIPDSK
jgi:site-specific DNA-methyltransferase (adenine-specific)